jgi:hypothetical protein
MRLKPVQSWQADGSHGDAALMTFMRKAGFLLPRSWPFCLFAASHHVAPAGITDLRGLAREGVACMYVTGDQDSGSPVGGVRKISDIVA